MYVHVCVYMYVCIRVGMYVCTQALEYSKIDIVDSATFYFISHQTQHATCRAGEVIEGSKGMSQP